MRLKDKQVKILHKKIIDDFKVRESKEAMEWLFRYQTVHWGSMHGSGLGGLAERASRFKDGIVRVNKEKSNGLYQIDIIGYGGPNGLKLEAQVFRKDQQEVIVGEIFEN